ELIWHPVQFNLTSEFLVDHSLDGSSNDRVHRDWAPIADVRLVTGLTRGVHMKPDFFVNINECCIKSIKVILFKVISIISFTSLPPLWQFVDSSPKKI